jgi:hypothetical protein
MAAAMRPCSKAQALRAGCYELVFAAGDYFAALGVAVPEPRFVDRVTIAFRRGRPQAELSCAAGSDALVIFDLQGQLKPHASRTPFPSKKLLS